MKKILIPTDFSENAKNALFYALEFDKHDDVIFDLLHVVLPIVTSVGDSVALDEKGVEIFISKAEKSIQELKKE